MHIVAHSVARQVSAHYVIIDVGMGILLRLIHQQCSCNAQQSFLLGQYFKLSESISKALLPHNSHGKRLIGSLAAVHQQQFNPIQVIVEFIDFKKLDKIARSTDLKM